MGWELARLFIVLIIVLPLAYFGTRFYALKARPYAARFKPGGLIRVRDSIALGGNRHLLVVQLGEKGYLLGVSERGIELIAELPFLPETDAFEHGSPAGQGFAQVLKSLLSGGRHRA